MKESTKRFMVYVSTITSLALVGLTFTPIGALIGAVLGFFLARRILNNKEYAAGVAKRQGWTNIFWEYAGVGVAGFVFFNVIGLIIGLLLVFAYNWWRNRK